MDSPRFNDPVLDSMIFWFKEEAETSIQSRPIDVDGIRTNLQCKLQICYAVGVFTRHGEEILIYQKLPGCEITPLGTDVEIDELISEPVR